MKKIGKRLSFLLALALLCQLMAANAFAASHACPGTGFSDMPAENHWAHSFLDKALNAGIIAGTSKTTISPDDICTRAQVYTMFWRAMGSPEPAETYDIKDVSPDAYYYKAVCWVYGHSAFIAYGDYFYALDDNGYFHPDRPCTRLEVVKILSAHFFYWNKFVCPEPTLTVEESTHSNQPPVPEHPYPFLDITGNDPNFAADEWLCVSAGERLGWIKGTSATTFTPNRPCPRAEAVTFVLQHVAFLRNSGLMEYYSN